MKKLTILSNLAIAAALGVSFASCTTETTGPGTTTTVAPSNLMALSKNANTISLMWTRDANDAGGDTVYVSENNGTPSVLPPVMSGNTLDVTNLKTQSIYTFFVRNAGGSSSSVRWMTANRFGSESAPIRIWEFSSNGNPSGIDLSTGQTYHVGANHPEAAPFVDFVLDDITPDADFPTGMDFESANILLTSMKQSYVHKDQVYGSLDSYYSANLDTTGMKDHPDFSIPTTSTGSRILTVETATGNIAKVEILKQSGGSLYGGTGTDRYIDLVISYNPAANQPYAARPRPTGRQVRNPVF